MKIDFMLLKKKTFILFIVLLSFSPILSAQENNNDFWKNVRYGGGMGLSFSNGYFFGSLAPAAIYDFNQYVSAGVGIQGSYANGNNYDASTYGGSLLGFFNPIPALRLSSEFELLQVNISRQSATGRIRDSYAYPALFMGAGYRSGPVVAGIRYDVLYDRNKSIYNSPFMPFVSVFF